MNVKTKTHNLYKFIFLFVVFLGIGYAFLEANLNINGDVTVEAPELNVYVQSTSVTSGSTTGTPTIIGNDKREVDFTTALTNDVNSFFETSVTLVNKGSGTPYLFNIDVKVYDGTNEVTLAAPYEYKLTKGDGTEIEPNHTLAVNGTDTYKIKFNYISGTDMSTVTTYPNYTFKITFNYKTDTYTFPEGKTKDNLTVGDEVCIRGECFNFLHYDGTNNEDIVMLSKYNLKVGNIYNSSYKKIGEYTQSDEGYGLQSSEAKGYVSRASTCNGTVSFSATSYWDDNGSPKSDYPGSYYPGPNYPTIYDATNYKGAPGENDYSIVYYVDEYKTKLTGYGVTIKDARLLTYSEAIDSSIGCSEDSYSCPTTGFITNTSFWLGSAYIDGYVWLVYSDGYFLNSIFNDDRFGVRPVVIIEKDSI